MRVGILTGEEHGSNYYSGTLVKKYLGKRGIGAFHTKVFDVAEFMRCDVAYMIRPFFLDAEAIPQIHALKRAGVPIVMHADDHFYEVPAWSPSAPTCHRYETQRRFTAGFAAADLVVTPSRTLAREFKARFPNAAFRIIPNAFDRDVKLLRPYPRLDGAEVPTIGWSGGAQHQGDLAAINDVLIRCLDRGWKLSFVGDVPNGMNGRRNTSFIPGCSGVELYMQSMPLARFHVALAPLIDNLFNRCKSALKAVEYGHLCGCPMVLQDLDTYDEIEADGRRIQKVKGHDPDDWMRAIEAGLEVYREEGRRYSLAPKYDMENTIDLWVEAFRDAHRIARGRDVGEAPVEVHNEPVPAGAS